MKTIDLTHKINEKMPVYPGTEKPILKEANTIEKDGFAEKLLTMPTHTGTHMDAPAHMIKGAKTLDEFDISHFSGRGIVIDAQNCIGKISKEFIQSKLKKNYDIDFLLFRTAWSLKWEKDDYFYNFPVFDDEASEYISTLLLKGVGVDCISVDSIDSSGMKNHLTLMRKEILIIENLCNLEKLIDKEFIFHCFPLKIENADGSPIRAVACIE